MVLFQGKSGSGKTTLLNVMSGLERPTAGRVTYRNRDFSRFSSREMTAWRRKEAGFIFQSFALIPGLTAIENVDLAARLSGRSPRVAKKLAEEYLHALGILDRAGHRVAELSGGEQQRVAVARGLASAPTVLFADEPTGELDHAMSRTVMNLLREAVDRSGATVCLTSHDPAVRAFADTAYTLADGRISTGQEV